MQVLTAARFPLAPILPASSTPSVVDDVELRHLSMWCAPARMEQRTS